MVTLFALQTSVFIIIMINLNNMIANISLQ